MVAYSIRCASQWETGGLVLRGFVALSLEGWVQRCGEACEARSWSSGFRVRGHAELKVQSVFLLRHDGFMHPHS